MPTVNTNVAHVTSAPFLEYSEACWAEISDADYAYLTGPRNYPAPCWWCRGRTLHHPCCYKQCRARETVTVVTNPAELREATEDEMQQENQG